ncbi:hypothetical protein [Streptomyces caniferus]|uniref:hypothetical protein n=1 Tax=Streptomyces caniferus TaxID=285557 RepID=UPI00382CF8A0
MGLTLLRVAEVIVRVAVTVGSVLAGWGSAGAIGAFAAGAAVTSVAGLATMRGRSDGQAEEMAAAEGATGSSNGAGTPLPCTMRTSEPFPGGAPQHPEIGPSGSQQRLTRWGRSAQMPHNS